MSVFSLPLSPHLFVEIVLHRALKSAVAILDAQSETSCRDEAQSGYVGET